MKIKDIVEGYEEKFNKPFPLPMGIELEDVLKVAEEHIKKGEPIPDDYDWYKDVPDDADV